MPSLGDFVEKAHNLQIEAPQLVEYCDLVIVRAFNAVFLVYVAILLILPFGALAGMNVKVIILLLLSVLTIASGNAYGLCSYRSLLSILMTIGPLFLWVVLGMWNGFNVTMVMSQFRDIAVTIIGCWLTALYISKHPGNKRLFMRTVIWSVSTTAAIKCVLIVYSLKTGVPVSSAIFHSLFITTDLNSLDIGLGRIQFISDGILPICLFALQTRRREIGIGPVSALLITFLYFISVTISFSRFLWVYAILAFVLGIIIAKKELIHGFYIVLIGGVSITNFAILQSLFEYRFSENVAGTSDVERTEQLRALIVFIKDAPFFGHGLGSYTTTVIRSIELPYSYELQLVALVGQIGLMGTLMLFMALAAYCNGIVMNKTVSIYYRVSLGILLAVWIIGGLTNPLLMSSTASVTYGTLYVLIGVSAGKDIVPT
jgi:hypothetical protein